MVYLVISSTGSLDGYIDLHSGDIAIDYPGPGEVVVNTGLAENLGLAVGDTIQLRDEELGALTVTISGICDNYVSNYVYVAAETYQQQQLGQALLCWLVPAQQRLKLAPTWQRLELEIPLC